MLLFSNNHMFILFNLKLFLIYQFHFLYPYTDMLLPHLIAGYRFSWTSPDVLTVLTEFVYHALNKNDKACVVTLC